MVFAELHSIALLLLSLQHIPVRCEYGVRINVLHHKSLSLAECLANPRVMLVDLVDLFLKVFVFFRDHGHLLRFLLDLFLERQQLFFHLLIDIEFHVVLTLRLLVRPIRDRLLGLTRGQQALQVERLEL